MTAPTGSRGLHEWFQPDGAALESCCRCGTVRLPNRVATFCKGYPVGMPMESRGAGARLDDGDDC